MLTREEITTVTGHLANHLSATGDIRALVQTVFAPNHTAILLALPTNINRIEDLSRWLVQYCVASWWPTDTTKASLLELLLARLINTAGVGALANLRNRVNLRIDPNAEIFQARWVIANQPFFDRGGTRLAIQQLIEGVTHPILRINGPNASGKTYTFELLSHLSDQGPPHVRFTFAKVEPDSAPSYTVEELAQELTLPMTIEEPMPQRSTSSYSKALSLWVMRNTMKQSGVWILVLDGFGDENVREEVRQLVEALCAQVLAPEVVKRVRLVLIDYKAALPGNLGARMLEDMLPDPMTIKAEDVEECLVEYNERRRRLGQETKVIEPGQVGALAASLLGRAPATPAERLRSIYSELCTLWRM